jgi:NAD(P)H-dependent FMN reductase
MKILVISGSLRTNSRSRLLAKEATNQLEKSGQPVELLDLREYPLPLSDGGAAYEHPNVTTLNAKIKAADAILVAVPIYNFDINAAVKNLIELTGSAWEDKVVGFVCAAGGRASYMSVMNIGNDLMLDFRCLIVPRFVYAVSSDFSENSDGSVTLASSEIRERLQSIAQELIRLGRLNQTTQPV